MDICRDDVAPVTGRRQAQHFLHVADPHPMKALVDGIFAFLLLELMHTKDSLLLRGEGPRLLLAEEVFFLPQADMASKGTLFRRGRRGACSEE